MRAHIAVDELLKRRDIFLHAFRWLKLINIQPQPTNKATTMLPFCLSKISLCVHIQLCASAVKKYVIFMHCDTHNKHCVCVCDIHRPLLPRRESVDDCGLVRKFTNIQVYVLTMLL